MRIFEWYKERRVKRETRYEDPGLIAFYWDGSRATGKRVKDVSMTGAYLFTEERWYPGTILEVTLKRDDSENAIAPHFGLLCEVVRNREDGIAVRFLANGRRKMLERFIRGAVAARRAEDRLGSATGTDGQALVELALVIPMLFVLIILGLNFGFLIYGWIAVENATRAAADYAVLSGSSAGLPPTATSSTLQSVIKADMTHLPGLSSSNPTACVQSTTAVLMEMPSGACGSYSAPSADTDTTGTVSYSDISVDITYAYRGFFPGSTVLGLAIPVLPTSIHRRTVMRIL